MFKRLVAAGLVFGMAALAPPAEAQTACLPRAVAVDRLEGTHREAPVIVGLVDGQQAIEFWAQPGGGGWTLLLTRVDGNTCVMASGPEWLTLLPLTRDPES